MNNTINLNKISHFIFFLILAYITLIIAAKCGTSYDAYWHIKVGEWILQQQQAPTTREQDKRAGPDNLDYGKNLPPEIAQHKTGYSGNGQPGRLAVARLLAAQPMPRQRAEQDSANCRQRRDQPLVITVTVIESARNQLLVDIRGQASGHR